MTQPDSWTTREVAIFLRLFATDPQTGEPDPTRPDPTKVHGLAHRNPDFPRPLKLGKLSRYLIAEVVAWRNSRRGGPSTAQASPSKRGPKMKAVSK